MDQGSGREKGGGGEESGKTRHNTRLDAPMALLSAVLDAARLSTGSTVVPAERDLVKIVGS